MRKFTLIFVLTLFAAWSHAQIIHGVSWVNWANEPDYPDITGYAANPYETPKVTIYKAPANWQPIADNAAFDATWDTLGAENMIAKPTNVEGGDLYNLAGDATFGASWKGVHDGTNFYLLLKYRDVNGVADDASLTFEIMAQPTSFPRHELTFTAASDSTAEKTASKTDLVMQYQNQAYARSVELGGGKAVFKDGMVTEYAASLGVTKNAWQAFYVGNWGANEAGLEALLDASHYWNETDGIIRAVYVMSLDGALSYPTNPADLAGERTALEVGDTFSFDVKSNATTETKKVEYFWSADRNNGYASNYYSGELTLSPYMVGEEPAGANYIIHGVSWVNWANEPDYPDITGYAANPYETPEVNIYQAPATWEPIADNAAFDATWDILGTEHMISNPTNVEGGDLFNLAGDATFGASWKGVHDGTSFYLLLKYRDVNAVADDASKTFEIMAQPTGFPRHEKTFTSAADSTADKTASATDLVIQYQNQAYARSVELGGGKAVFKDGMVTEYAASRGVTKNAWQAFYVGNWGANEAGLEALLDASHYWNETGGVLRAVYVMSLSGALSYPTNPADLAGERTALEVGDTFSFDVKSNALKDEKKVEYFWSADRNNGYASNYYSGELTLLPQIVTSAGMVKAPLETRVYINNGTLFVKGGKPVNLEIYNVLGAKLKSAQNVSRLSMQDMQNGIYLIRVNNERMATKVVKF